MIGGKILEANLSEQFLGVQYSMLGGTQWTACLYNEEITSAASEVDERYW